MTEKLVLKGDNCGSGFTPSMALILPTDMAALSFASIHYPHSSPKHAGGLSPQGQCHIPRPVTYGHWSSWPCAVGDGVFLPERSAASWEAQGKPNHKNCSQGLCILTAPAVQQAQIDTGLIFRHLHWTQVLDAVAEDGKRFWFCQKVAFISFLRKCFQQTWICEILSESCFQHPRLLKTFIFTSGQFDMTFTSSQATAQHVIVNTKLPPTALHPSPWNCRFLQCSVFSYRAICG